MTTFPRCHLIAMLLTLAFPQTANSDDNTQDTEEIKQLTPAVRAIQQRQYDRARKLLQKVCANQITRRCQYVWGRYYETQGEFFAAYTAYDRFLRLAEQENPSDETLRMQIRDARQTTEALARKLKITSRLPSETRRTDADLGPNEPSPSAKLSAEETSTSHGSPDQLSPPTAKVRISTDLSGTLIQGLTGYPDGITVERGITILKQPLGSRQLSFSVPGLDPQLVNVDLLSRDSTINIETTWQPQLIRRFPEFAIPQRWRTFVNNRRSPERHSHTISPSKLAGVAISSSVLAAGIVMTAVLSTRSQLMDSGLVAGVGYTPMILGGIGTVWALVSIALSVPTETLPPANTNKWGVPVPAPQP